MFDQNKADMWESFGISLDRHKELLENYIHGSLGDCIDRIHGDAKDGQLADNETFFLLIALGIRCTEHFIADVDEKYQKYIAQRDVEQSSISQKG